MKIFCTIVFYNSYIEKSAAISNLIKAINIDDCEVIAVDNSVVDKYLEANLQFCKRKKITYLRMDGNIGLSKATNKALDYIKRQNPEENDIVITLNDDTSVTNEFILDVREKAQKYKEYDIFVPYMQGQNGIYYSPAKAGFFKNYHPETLDTFIPQDRFFAIYSCCACKWKVYKDYRYDEKLFMDLIDNNFCDDQRTLGRKFMPLKIVIQQNYALKNEGLSMDRIQNRWKIWVPDFLTYCKKKKMRLVGYYLSIAARGVMFSIKCKNIKFWFWGMSYAIKCFRGNKQ